MSETTFLMQNIATFSYLGVFVVAMIANVIVIVPEESRLPWIEKHVNKVLFFSRFVIQLHLLGPLIAGQTKMPLKKFIAIELAALVIYASALISLGVYFRDRIEFIISDIRIVHNIIFIVIGIAVLFIIFKFLRRIILGNP